jgi:hypothetical protein
MMNLPESVQAYFYTVNDVRPDAFLAAFDTHAYVFDNNREFKGKAAIGKWSESDVFGPNVRFEITDATEYNGTYIVIASVDGDFDKTNLPDPLLLKHQFTLAPTDGKIKDLFISLP